MNEQMRMIINAHFCQSSGSLMEKVGSISASKNGQNLHLVWWLCSCTSSRSNPFTKDKWRKTQEGIEQWKSAASAVDKDSWLQDWSFSNALQKHLTRKKPCVCARDKLSRERKMKQWSWEWRWQHEKGSVYDNALNPHKGKRVGAEALPALWLMLSEGLSSRSFALIHWALVALWNVNGEASWFL